MLTITPAAALVSNGAKVYIASRKMDVVQKAADDLNAIGKGGQCIAWASGTRLDSKERTILISPLFDGIASKPIWSPRPIARNWRQRLASGRTGCTFLVSKQRERTQRTRERGLDGASDENQ